MQRKMAKEKQNGFNNSCYFGDDGVNKVSERNIYWFPNILSNDFKVYLKLNNFYFKNYSISNNMFIKLFSIDKKIDDTFWNNLSIIHIAIYKLFFKIHKKNLNQANNFFRKFVRKKIILKV